MSSASVNALDSGARVVGCFENSNTPPTFVKPVTGRLDLRDALLGQVDSTAPAGTTHPPDEASA